MRAGENSKWLDATHTDKEQNIYSVMYRVTIAQGKTDGYFSVKSLQQATGIGGHDTVRIHLRGLVKKLSVEIVNVDKERTLGRLYRVYTRQQIEERREKAGIVIDPISKRILTAEELAREPSREPVGHLAGELLRERGGALSGRPKSGSKALSKQESMYNNHNNPSVSTSSSVPASADDEKLSRTRNWFEQLSGGGNWKAERDDAAFDEIRHCNQWHILLGLCYSVSRSPEHKMSSLKYAVPAILNHYRDMAEFPDATLAEIAYKTKMKTFNCLATGNWTVAEWEVGRE